MLKNIILFILLVVGFTSYGQKKSFWKEANTDSMKKVTTKEYSSTSKTFTLNVSGFETYIKSKPTTIDLPDANGKIVTYKIEETNLLHPVLAKKYPNKKSYKGVAVNNHSQTVNFTVTGLGVHATIYKVGASTQYLNPISNDKAIYSVFKRSKAKVMGSFQCYVEERAEQVKQKSNAKITGDLKLRVFELALATTGEYSQFHINEAGVSGGTDAEKKAAVLDAVIVTMNRVNGIFERDLAVTMQLIPNTDLLFYLDGNTDPYTNNDGGTMLDENQTNIDAVIGAGNYDIGHVFSTGGGGVASLFSPCGSGRARGVTGQSQPVGDPFSVDYVAHEMGHQFGANHTFNSTEGGCSGNRNDATAVEPGSGSTIMSYAGLCSPQNVQPLANDYFNTISIQEMVAFLTSSSANCDDENPLPNNTSAPVANAGLDLTVPKSTPLVLRGQASDADGDAITYCWEQTDNDVIGISNPPVATQTRGAVFRSLSPTTAPNRYLPALSTVLNGNLSSTWQVLPSVGRTMDFALTVRDNASGGGQTAIDDIKVTVDGNSGPFVVTSQNSDEVFWAAGTQETITWDVANTNVAPVNCSNVNILLSIDGGATFPITLASNVPNDGSQEITVPNNLTVNGRILVEGANHIFYAVNQKEISITNDYAISIADNKKQICAPNDAVYSVDLNFASGFTEEVTLSANNLPSGATVSFSPSTANANTNVQMTVSNISSSMVGNYTINVVGTSSSVTRNTQVVLDIFDNTINQPVLSSPANAANNVLAKGGSLSWNTDTNVQNYTVEIATDAMFNSMVETVNTSSNSYTPTSLVDATTYYWRVKPSNLCATGEFSEIFVFTTSEIVCNTTEATGLPVNIPDDDSNGVSSIINISEDVVVNDINVTINVTHSWMRDLTITLKSPAGTEVKLLERQCRGNAGNVNMAATFDDDGVVLACVNSSPVITGTIIPAELLSQLKGESAQGNWVLTVTDGAGDDTGSLTSWSLEICESQAVATVENETFANLSVWPNPTKDVVNVTFASLNQSDTVIKLYDTLGRLMFKKEYNTQSVVFRETIATKGLSSGLYFVQIAKGKTTTVKRLLVL